MFLSLAAGILLQAVRCKNAENFMHLCMKQRPDTQGFSKTLFGFLSQLQILIIRSENSQAFWIKGFGLLPCRAFVQVVLNFQSEVCNHESLAVVSLCDGEVHFLVQLSSS